MSITVVTFPMYLPFCSQSRTQESIKQPNDISVALLQPYHFRVLPQYLHDVLHLLYL